MIAGLMQKRTTTVEIVGPFGLKATALGHGWHECAPMSWCEAGGCLQVIERVGDRPVRVSITEASRDRKRTRLGVVMEGEDVSAKDVALLRGRVCTMLQADLDLSEFYRMTADHPRLNVLKRLGAGRYLRSPSMTENIIKAVCGTNVNWTQAVKMINRIAQLGPHVPHFRNLTAWPTPREILSAGADYLKGVARLGYRTESILSLCRSAVDGSFDEAELDAAGETETTDELLGRLTSIRGVGPTTANFLLAFLGRFDRVGVDSATLAFVARNYTNGRKPSVREAEALFARYGRWQHSAYWFEHWLEWRTARSLLNGKPRRGAQQRAGKLGKKNVGRG